MRLVAAVQSLFEVPVSRAGSNSWAVLQRLEAVQHAVRCGHGDVDAFDIVATVEVEVLLVLAVARATTSSPRLVPRC